MSGCVCVCVSILTFRVNRFGFRGCACSDSALSNSAGAVLSSPQCGTAEDTGLVLCPVQRCPHSVHVRPFRCDPVSFGAKDGFRPCLDLRRVFLQREVSLLASFCLCKNQRPPVMSLPEFLREGGEASYRIMNRLSHLIQNFDISGLGSSFQFSPASRKNSWTDWDGKTDRRKSCLTCVFVLKSYFSATASLQCCRFVEKAWLQALCECVVHNILIWPELCKATCPEPHKVFPVGFPCFQLSCFFVSLCVSHFVCGREHDCAA